jgi:hypothetical protein
MSDDNAKLKAPVDKILLAAWRRLLYYDRISYHEKRNFVNLRKIVIVISLFGTLTSVAVLLFGEMDESFRNLVALSAISLPIIALGVMQFIARFAAPTTWIQYRYAAERIRSNIYLYRCGAGEYNIELHKRDDLLASKVQESVNIITQTVPQPLKSRKQGKLGEFLDNITLTLTLEEAQKEILPALYYTEGDDGFSPLTHEEYTEYRMNNQLGWYNKAVSRYYNITKRFSIYSLVTTTTGSIIGVLLASQPDQIRWVGLVAIANAVSVALNSWGNMAMFGDTYKIFDDTARKLKDHQMIWHTLDNNPEIQNYPDKLEHEKLRFIQETEDILMHELQTWFDTATEIQMANDQMMMKNIRETQASTGLVDISRIRLMVSQMSPQAQEQIIGYLQKDIKTRQ